MTGREVGGKWGEPFLFSMIIYYSLYLISYNKRKAKKEKGKFISNFSNYIKSQKY